MQITRAQSATWVHVGVWESFCLLDHGDVWPQVAAWGHFWVYGPTSTRICFDVPGSSYYQRSCKCPKTGPPPEARWVSDGHVASGTMQIWVTYAATWCLVTSRPRLLPRAMSVSMVLPVWICIDDLWPVLPPRAIQIPMVWAVACGCAVVWGLYHCWGPMYLGALHYHPGLVSSGPGLLLKDMSGFVCLLQLGSVLMSVYHVTAVGHRHYACWNLRAMLPFIDPEKTDPALQGTLQPKSWPCPSWESCSLSVLRRGGHTPYCSVRELALMAWAISGPVPLLRRALPVT